jgi:ketosteroid isomerase-like protein
MSQEDIQHVRRVYDHFSATGALDLDRFASTFVVDMSNFEIWPEDHFYEGHEGAMEYLRAWLEPWDTYEHHLEALLDAGDQVVAILHISATARRGGAAVEMRVGHVWTVIDGTLVRLTAYSEPDKALEAAGLSE